MGKASSSKKVARAAQTGKRVKVRTSRGSIFPVALATVVVLGVTLIVWARADRRATVSKVPPAIGLDRWSAAYGIYICDAFLEPLPQLPDNPLGIATTGAGIIDINPLEDSVAGRNARLGKFLDHEEVKLGNDKLEVPAAIGRAGVTKWENGDKCGDAEGELKVQVWTSKDDTSGKVYSSDFKNIRFDKDKLRMTIAFVPKGATIPRPTSEALLDTTPAAATTTTVAGSDTTVAGTATTAPGDTTVAPTTVADATTVASTTVVPTTSAG